MVAAGGRAGALRSSAPEPSGAAGVRSVTGGYPVVSPDGLGGSHLADLIPETEPLAAAVGKRLPPPGWVRPEGDDPHAFDRLPDEPPSESYVFEPERDRFALTSSTVEQAEEPPGLSSAGAFGGAGDGGRRFGITAFDPGRRGVRALAAVAAVVIVIAAVLAWRARPRVDPVAPPPLNAVETSDGDQGDEPVAVRGSASAATEVVVAVGGKVRKPGLVRLALGARVADALTAAGGAEPGVDVAMLNLARKVVDGELIMVGVTPSPGQVFPTGPAAPTAGAAGAGGLVNLNTATLADLDTLPGVGPVLAQRILDAREAQGGFQAVTDLRKVDGIGDARYEQLKDLVTV
ncbi:ComEA family DNA-binding protein [Actinoplanes sp. LDG1-06]|uniref:ComEA family DNA-binding protein n=1 Tax=Paractinoplanes ovalisporus TaxID=2810368 RepID=A0ABS2APJ0_9ACTN|nr:ComEA family DNA-binding protein [Actinoplanes ovalisporus]